MQKSVHVFDLDHACQRWLFFALDWAIF